MRKIESVQTKNAKTKKYDIKIDFIEEIIFNEYNIQFGIREYDLAIKVVSEKTKNLFYYQNIFTLEELQNMSKIFALYENVKDIIYFFKNLQVELEEKNEELIIKFNAFMPDGKNQLIELNLQTVLIDTSDTINLIKNLFEEIQSLKINMNNEISNMKEYYETEIKELKDNIPKYETEILNLKEEIEKCHNENIKLWEEIDKLKQNKEQSNGKIEIKEKKIELKYKINFILDYIKQTDNTLKINFIKLLYRGSRDTDRTKICHQLCDNKQNVLIVMQSDTDYIFGGYSKIGFKTINESGKKEWKIDNNCFLFSINLKKIYPVIKDQKVICHINDSSGLCFWNALSFFDGFLHDNINMISYNIKTMFNGLKDNYEMNGGKNKFKCTELEVFQLC